MMTQYITFKGDRWDTVAFKAYGDSNRITELIEANPTVTVDVVFEDGIRLNVPILEAQSETDTSLLPPWKR